MLVVHVIQQKMDQERRLLGHNCFDICISMLGHNYFEICICVLGHKYCFKEKLLVWDNMTTM